MYLPDLDAILSSGLPCSDRMVLIAIAAHANAPEAEVWPSIETIAKRAGVHPVTAVRSVAKLRSLGWLTARRRFGKSTTYKVQRPASTSATLILSDDYTSTSATLVSVLAPRYTNTPLESPIEYKNIKPEEPKPDPAEQNLFAASSKKPLPPKLGPLELRSIPGLKRLPKDMEALTELLNYAGMDLLKKATLDCLNSGREAYESNVSPIAIELKRLKDNPPEPYRPPAEELPDDLHELPDGHRLKPTKAKND